MGAARGDGAWGAPHSTPRQGFFGGDAKQGLFFITDMRLCMVKPGKVTFLRNTFSFFSRSTVVTSYV